MTLPILFLPSLSDLDSHIIRPATVSLRVALRLPWWTLQGSYEAARDMGQLKGSPGEVRYSLSEEAAAAAQAKVREID